MTSGAILGSMETDAEGRVWAGAMLVFAGLSITCGLISDGFVTADACTHYLYARFAFSDPVNWVDVWARPFCTALYAFPAHWAGRTGVRIESTFVAIGCAWLAVRIARGQGYRGPVLAGLFTLGQPLLFLYSFAEMTELPFALLLGAAFLAFQNRRLGWAALLLGLTPTARPEGFGFVLLGAFLLAAYRRARWVPLLLVPLLVWNTAGWWITGRVHPWWRWLHDAWPWSGDSLYGRGNPLVFVAALPLIVSPLVLPAMLVGMARTLQEIWREPRGWRSLSPIRFVTQSSVGSKIGRALYRDEPKDAASLDDAAHLRLCRVLTAVTPLIVLVAHSLLRAMGKLGSFGEPRYLLVVASFWGVLAGRGWEWIFQRLRWSRPIGWAVACVLAPMAMNLIFPVVPVRLSPDWVTARRFATWYETGPLHRSYPNVVASHPGIFYYLNEDPSGVARRGGFTRGVLDSAPPGTLLVWDPTLSSRNASADSAASLSAIVHAGWVHLPAIDDLLNGPGHSHLSWGSTTQPANPEDAWHVFRSPESIIANPD